MGDVGTMNRMRRRRVLSVVALASVGLVLAGSQRSPAASPPAELVSVLDTSGNQSSGPSISADGGLVGFEADFSIDNVPSGSGEVRNRSNKLTEAVPSPQKTPSSQTNVVLSSDGCTIVYLTTITASDALGGYSTQAVIAVNRCAAGATNVVVSHDRAHGQANDISQLAVSAHGKYVAFIQGSDVVRVERDASGNPVDTKTLSNHRPPSNSSPSLGDENLTGDVAITGLFGGSQQVLLWDPTKAATDPAALVLVSAQSGSTTVAGTGFALNPSMTPDGRYVAFTSSATNLAASAAQGTSQIYVREISTNATKLVSVAGGVVGNGNSVAPSISADGTQIAFESTSTNLLTPAVKTTFDTPVEYLDLLVARSTSGLYDSVAFDRVSIKPDGSAINPVSAANHQPTISANGRWVAFTSQLNAELQTGGTTGPNSDITSNVYVIGRAASLSIPPTDFGTLDVGQTTPAKTITVINNGIASVLPSTITAANGQFKITGGTCQPNVYISPGQSCTVTVTFKPSAAGARTGTLTVAEAGFAAITATGPLTGTGSPPATIPPTVPLVGALTIAPSPDSFGTTPVGVAAAPITFTVTSTGTADVPITGVTMSGPSAGEFVVANNGCAGQTLAPGATCSITVVFTPTKGNNHTATLTVTSKKLKASTALDGQGVFQPSIRLAPQAIDRGKNAVVLGINFPPGLAVDLRWSTGDRVYSTTVAADGKIFAQIPVLSGEQLGPRALLVVDQPGEFAGVSTPALIVLPSLQPPVNNNPAFKGVPSIIIRG